MHFDSGVQMDPAVLSLIRISAKRAYPNECCGFLWGDGTSILFAAEVDNVSAGDRKNHFQINSSAYIAAETFAESHGLTLLGIFHSHPDSPAIPSTEDTKMALPNFFYIIIPLKGNMVQEERCWVLDGSGKFKELHLNITIPQSPQTSIWQQ